MFTDPDWFFHVYEDGAFSNKGTRLRAEAEEIKRKSTSVKIPQKGSEQLVAEYTFSEKGFCNLEIVPSGGHVHRGLTFTRYRSVIDFSLPREPIPGVQHTYDKLGYRIFLKNVKYILFGDSRYKMTCGRCEEFFENDANFACS